MNHIRKDEKNGFIDKRVVLFENELVKTNYLNGKDIELLRKYNSTSKSIAETTVKDMLEQALEKYADNRAVSLNGRSISYRELDKTSLEFADKLKAMGAERGNIVGIKAEKTIETIIAAVGIFRSECVYLPVHKEYPHEKKEHIFKSCNCRFFAEGTSVNELSTYDSKKKDNYTFDSREESLAYIIYTSGSTGLPKGVAISNRAVCNTILDINERFSVGCADRIIGLSALTFDLSIYDILGAFQCGAELVLVSDQRDIKNICSILRNESITLWNSVPAIIEMVVLALKDNECIDSIRNILLSGDKIPVTLPQKLKKYFPNAQIYSLGGATEGSIWSIYYPITYFPPDSVRVPYGYPLANQRMTVRDKDMKLCPIGVEGEICIGGAGVAMGYMNDHEKTAASYVNTPEGIVYRTGDYGVMNEKGYMEFLGRRDAQVKLNGYRIETGEVESAALQNKDIIAASAFVYTDETNGNKLLALCYTSDTQPREEEIRNGLKELLVDYMMPHIIVKTDELPLTANGKVDTKNLCRMISEMSDIQEDGNFDEFEQKIAEIWKSVLGVKAVSRNSNFFSSGGDSLKAMRMIEALSSNGFVSESITVADIFSVTDFSALTSRLKELAEVKMVEEENMEEGEL